MAEDDQLPTSPLTCAATLRPARAFGEGYWMAQTLIVSFMLMATVSVALLAINKIDIQSLVAVYSALGVLAKMFGLDQIVLTWLPTRGQTSSSAAVEQPKT